MCNPVVGAVLGGGQAALGAIGQNKAIKARNKNRAQLYANDLARIHGEHLTNISSYYLRGVDAEIGWDENTIAASQKVDEQQVIINQRIAESLQQSEADYVKMISDPRIAKSLERTGQTARRASIAGKAAVGRAKAARRGEIDRQRDSSLTVLQEVYQIKRAEDRKFTQNIGFEPQRSPDPPKPVFEKGPSLFSTLTKIALGAAQGYLMGDKLKKSGLFQGGGKKTLSESGTKLFKYDPFTDFEGPAGWDAGFRGELNVSQNFVPSQWSSYTPLEGSSLFQTQNIVNADSTFLTKFGESTSVLPDFFEKYPELLNFSGYNQKDATLKNLPGAN